jgi:hypothetical protein
MSDAWGLDDDNYDSGDQPVGDGPKPLRDAYKAQKEKNAALEARLAALEAATQKAQAQSVFQTLGVDPNVAAMYSGEPDPEKIKGWVDNMRAAFGGTATTAPPVSTEPVLSADAQAQYQRLSEAGQGGTPLGNAEAALASIKDARSTEDLLAAWKNIH